MTDGAESQATTGKPEESGKSHAASAEAVGAQSPPGSGRLLKRIFVRELDTAIAQPSYAAFLVGLTLVLLGLAWSGGGIHGGYVPTAVDLLLPLQLLVPVVAVTLGYQAIRNDERRGELDVLETYPVSAWHLVAGIYLGRAVGAVLAVLVPLLLLMLPIAVVGGPTPLVYATHTGADSPWLYLRFVVLTVLFALVMLAIVVALSAVVSTTRTAIAAGTLALVVLVFGLDLAIAYGFAGGLIGESGLLYSLAISPLSAYRGLVLETAIVVVAGTGPQAAAPVASLVGLLVWGAVSLVAAVRALR